MEAAEPELITLANMKIVGKSLKKLFLKETKPTITKLKELFQKYPFFELPSKIVKKDIQDGVTKLQIPLPFFAPGIIFEITDVDYRNATDTYFRRLFLQDINIKDFLWLLTNKVEWINVNSDRLRNFQWVIKNISETLNNDPMDINEDYKKYPKIECDASKILANIGKYVITLEDHDKTEDIYNLINLCNDIYDEDKIDAKKHDPLLRPILKKLKDKGFGLFALKEYNPGDFVARYGGVIKDDNLQGPYSADPFAPGTPLEYKKSGWYVDATHGWTLEERGRFLNHTSEAGADNCEFEAVYPSKKSEKIEDVIPGLDKPEELRTFLEKSHLYIVAIRHINIGDELLINYGIEYQFYNWIPEWRKGMSKEELNKLIPPSTVTVTKRIMDPVVLENLQFSCEKGTVFYDDEQKEYLFKHAPQ